MTQIKQRNNILQTRAARPDITSRVRSVCRQIQRCLKKAPKQTTTLDQKDAGLLPETFKLLLIIDLHVVAKLGILWFLGSIILLQHPGRRKEVAKQP